MEVGEGLEAYWCVRDFDSTLLWPGYETYMLLTLLLLPLTIMITTYTAICRAVRKMAETRQKMSVQFQNSKNIIYRLILVCFIRMLTLV